MVLEEMGDYKRALAHLEQFKSKVVDKLSWKEKRGKNNSLLMLSIVLVVVIVL
jgi:hypothetical protein